MPDSWPLRHRRVWPALPIEADIDKDDPTRCPCGRVATTTVVTASGAWPVCSGCVTVFQRYPQFGLEVDRTTEGDG